MCFSAWLPQVKSVMIIILSAQQSLAQALQFLQDLRFDFSPPALIIHERMQADTDHLRSLLDSQPCTQPHNPQPLTIGQIISSFSAQQGIYWLFPTNNPHRTAPQCDISKIQNCFRRCSIANSIKIVEINKNMNNNVESRCFNRSNATRSQCLCIKQEKYP